MTEDNSQEVLSDDKFETLEQLPDMIRVFHLTNGEVLIATVESYNSDFALIWSPFVITRTYDAMDNLIGFDMKSYLCDLVDEDEIIPLSLKNTFTVTAPSVELMQYYIGNCLIKNDDEDSDDDGNDSELLIQEEEERTHKAARKRVLH